MKASILFAGTLVASMASAVSMSRVGVFSLSGEGDTSGITYAGGNTYYVIDDKTEQLTKYTITLSDAGAIQSITMGASVATGLKDAEGCAYDPGSGRVWVSDGCGTGVTHREKYFAELPAKDDTEFGRFWKRITWPQAHGFYKEKSHLPYETFDFIRANARRKYGADWYAVTAKRAHERLHAWGLNTIANWSDEGVYRMRRTPYTLGLSTLDAPRLKGSTGWWGALPDPFAPKFETRLRAKARAAAAKMKDDPWCIGVFVDNELSWNKEPRMAEVGERYFSVVSRVLKEELPNHLYLGCRIAWGESVIYRLAARYCDVVSVNVYMTTPVRDLPEGADDKPMIIGEFHFGALDRGLFHTGLVPTRDQDDRAAHYRAYVESALDHPRFIGTHWFQWQDQPLTGRGDGENYQIGFLTVADTPYPELVRAARAVAGEMYPRRFGR